MDRLSAFGLAARNGVPDMGYSCMTFLRSRTAASLAVLAALSLTATPVLAREYYNGWRHRHHGDGVDGGDVLAGLLVVGGIAAIAAAASSTNDKPHIQHASYPGGPVAGDEAEQGDSEAPNEQPDSAQPDTGPSDDGDYTARDYSDDAPSDVQGEARGDDGDAAAKSDSDGASDGASNAPGGFDGAVDVCTAEIAHGDRQVDAVEAVRRMNDRYSVEGRLSDGRDFACSVDDGGHVRSVAVDGHAMI